MEKTTIIFELNKTDIAIAMKVIGEDFSNELWDNMKGKQFVASNCKKLNDLEVKAMMASVAIVASEDEESKDNIRIVEGNMKFTPLPNHSLWHNPNETPRGVSFIVAVDKDDVISFIKYPHGFCLAGYRLWAYVEDIVKESLGKI